MQKRETKAVDGSVLIKILTVIAMDFGAVETAGMKIFKENWRSMSQEYTLPLFRN